MSDTTNQTIVNVEPVPAHHFQPQSQPQSQHQPPLKRTLSEHFTETIKTGSKKAPIIKTIGILSIFHLIFGIIELVHIAKYSNDEIMHGCRNLWSWLLAAAIISVLSCVTAVYNGAMDRFRNTQKNERIHHIGGVCTALFVINCWAAVTHFNISKECHDFYFFVAPEFLKFVDVYYVLLWIIVSTIGCCCCIGVAALCVNMSN